LLLNLQSSNLQLLFIIAIIIIINTVTYMYVTIERILLSDSIYRPQSGTATNNCKIIAISKLYKSPEHMQFRFKVVVSPPAALEKVSNSGDS
jgi:hypothetical protein